MRIHPWGSNPRAKRSRGASRSDGAFANPCADRNPFINAGSSDNTFCGAAASHPLRVATPADSRPGGYASVHAHISANDDANPISAAGRRPAHGHTFSGCDRCACRRSPAAPPSALGIGPDRGGGLRAGACDIGGQSVGRAGGRASPHRA